MKLYASKEISKILQKAAQKSSADAPDIPMGLSIDELRQVASDAGIDPVQIENAIAEMEDESQKNERTFLGGPFSYHSQVWVEGEITGKQWEDMLIPIRQFFQSKGKINTRSSVLEWVSSWGAFNAAQVTTIKDNGKTKISANWSKPLSLVPFYLPVPFAAIASVLFASEFLELSAVPGMSFSLLVTGLTFLVGRTALRNHLNKGWAKLRQMVSDLETIANRPSTSTESDTKNAVAVDINDETDDSLKNILIDEDPISPDNKVKDRNQSRS